VLGDASTDISSADDADLHAAAVLTGGSFVWRPVRFGPTPVRHESCQREAGLRLAAFLKGNRAVHPEVDALVRAAGLEPARRCHRGILSVMLYRQVFDFTYLFLVKKRMC
jgi:hypothetical protein